MGKHQRSPRRGGKGGSEMTTWEDYKVQHGIGDVESEVLAYIVALERERGADTGHDCVFCGARIYGTMIGAGDGTGQRFADPACYYRSEWDKEKRKRVEAQVHARDHHIEGGCMTCMVCEAERDAAIADNAVLVAAVRNIDGWSSWDSDEWIALRAAVDGAALDDSA